MKKRIDNLTSKTLSDTTFLLKEYKYNYKHTDGHPREEHFREVYDHGDGASVLLYDIEKKTVILTKQFRLPTFLNGNKSGMSIEVCAGSLDGDTPEECAKKEALEETGYSVESLEKVLEVYASPAIMTEIAHLFIAKYSQETKVDKGGGLVDEQEYIDILELDFDKAFSMITTGEIKDARTIMLLQFMKIEGIMNV